MGRWPRAIPSPPRVPGQVASPPSASCTRSSPTRGRSRTSRRSTSVRGRGGSRSADRRVRARHPGRPALPRRPRPGALRLRRRGRRLVGRRARPRRAARSLRREPAHSAASTSAAPRSASAGGSATVRDGVVAEVTMPTDAVQNVPEAHGPARVGSSGSPGPASPARTCASSRRARIGAGDAVRVEQPAGPRRHRRGPARRRLIRRAGPARGPRGGRRRRSGRSSSASSAGARGGCAPPARDRGEPCVPSTPPRRRAGTAPTAPCRRAVRRRAPATASVRRLRARPVLRRALRLLRLQHLHERRARRRRRPGRLRRHGDRRARPRGEAVLDAAGLPAAPRRHRLLRRRHSDAAARRATSPALLGGVRDRFGLAPDAEVTTEANPDSRRPRRPSSSSPRRASPGSRSACSRPCRTCSPRSTAPMTPARVPRGRRWARAAGLAVSLDLIYGTPGESAADWRASLDAALDCEPDHVSAYALVVEEGTRLAVQVRRGELPAAGRRRARRRLRGGRRGPVGRGLRLVRGQQLGTDRRPTRAGTTSATGAATTGGASGRGRTRTSAGSGGGTCGTRGPTPPGSRTAAQPGAGPRGARRRPSGTRSRCCCGVRLAEGLPLAALSPAGREQVAGPRRGRAGRRPSAALVGRRVVLTRAGRLLADAVVRRLLRLTAPPSDQSRATRRSRRAGLVGGGAGVATMWSRAAPRRGRRREEKGSHVLPGAAPASQPPERSPSAGQALPVLGSVVGAGRRLLQRPLRHSLHQVRLATADLVVYVVILIAVSLCALVFVFAGYARVRGAGAFALILAALGWVIYVVLARVALEAFAVLFRIHDDTSRMADALGGAAAAAAAGPPSRPPAPDPGGGGSDPGPAGPLHAGHVLRGRLRPGRVRRRPRQPRLPRPRPRRRRTTRTTRPRGSDPTPLSGAAGAGRLSGRRRHR